MTGPPLPADVEGAGEGPDRPSGNRSAGSRRSIGPGARRDRPATGDERAVSDVIGFVLVFSLVATVVAIVSVTGMTALQETRDAEQTNNAERAMEVLADNMADLSERGAPSRATEISLNEAQIAMGEPVEVRIWDSDGAASFDETYTIRPIVYRAEDGTELVYAMGALFRVGRRGGVVLREWSPVFQRDAVMIPVLNTTSATGASQSIKSSTVLVRANARERTIAAATRSFEQAFSISVDSPRARLWKRMLGRRAGVDCDIANPGDPVVCEVTTEPATVYVVHTRATVALKR